MQKRGAYISMSSGEYFYLGHFDIISSLMMQARMPNMI
jgi:hypothetical protein